MINKKYLLLIAGLLWSFGGSVLMYRGVSAIVQSGTASLLNVFATIVFAISFYWFLFRRISTKHIARVDELNADKYPFYFFLSAKSYIMMFFMIGLGVSLRLTGIVPYSILMYFYPIMGSALLISAIRFYYYLIRN